MDRVPHIDHCVDDGSGSVVFVLECYFCYIFASMLESKMLELIGINALLCTEFVRLLGKQPLIVKQTCTAIINIPQRGYPPLHGAQCPCRVVHEST